MSAESNRSGPSCARKGTHNITNKVGMTGLALKITPGLDLILPGEVICGGMAADSTSFQIQVTFTNINQTRPLKMCLYLCFENTGAVHSFLMG